MRLLSARLGAAEVRCCKAALLELAHEIAGASGGLGGLRDPVRKEEAQVLSKLVAMLGDKPVL
jgi:hypothetical protein